MKTRQWLIVVDYQNDFVNPETGSLYVPWAEKLSSEINDIMLETKQKGWIIIASRELHPQGHISFASKLAMRVYEWFLSLKLYNSSEASEWSRL